MANDIQVHTRDGSLIPAAAAHRNLFTFKYRWTHLPSGDSGDTENLFLNYDAFVSCIERWNQTDASRWKYEVIA